MTLVLQWVPQAPSAGIATAAVVGPPGIREAAQARADGLIPADTPDDQLSAVYAAYLGVVAVDGAAEQIEQLAGAAGASAGQAAGADAGSSAGSAAGAAAGASAGAAAVAPAIADEVMARNLAIGAAVDVEAQARSNAIAPVAAKANAALPLAQLVEQLKVNGERLSIFPPEASGALGDNARDDTAELQAAWNRCGVLWLTPGKNYKVTDTLVAPSGDAYIIGNGARISPAFGTDYSKALFSNNKGTDASTNLYFFNFSVRGNCVLFDMRFTAGYPGAGLKLIGGNVNFNTNDGNRRAGTKFILADQIDFMDVRNCTVINADHLWELGSDPATRRNCTQIKIAQIYASQINAGGGIRGLDKAEFSQVDIAKCGAGFAFKGDNALIHMDQVHIEGLGTAGYTASGADMPAAALGYGHYIAPNVANDILFDQCSIIDLGTTGGVAKAGALIDQCFIPDRQNIEFNNCKFTQTAEGSAGYIPFANRGRFRWNGKWNFPSVRPTLYASGQLYIDVAIKDVAARQTGENILLGNTPYALIGAPAVATIAEVADDLNGQNSFSLTFPTANTQFFAVVNMPYGDNTLIFEGRRTAGQPRILIEQNGSPFTRIMDVLLVNNDDRFFQWRLPFFNPTPNLGYKVGFISTSANDALRCSHLSVAAGLQTEKPVTARHVVAALPVASAYWQGKNVLLRAAGVDDKLYTVYRNAAGALAWKLLF